MDEYTQMRDLLEQGRYLLASVFEHGFGAAGSLVQECGQSAQTFGEWGLAEGAKLWAALQRELDSGRFAAGNDWREAMACYSRLWQYLRACTERLDFLQAKARLQE